MPQDMPPYSKLIFITSSPDQRADDFRFWLYQRLKYARLPVRTRGADEAIGGGGFVENSIRVADPVLAIYSHPSDDRERPAVEHDIARALDLSKNVFLITFEETKIPEAYSTLKLYDFRRFSDEVFIQLRDDLLSKDYPKLHSTCWQTGADLLSNARMYSNFRSYYYVNIFDIIQDNTPYYKIAALQDLSDLGILSGLVMAVMTDDPDKEVRTQAALSLSKYDASNSLSLIGGQNKATIKEQPPSEYSKPYVFVSYAHKDAKAQALEIAKKLKASGVDIWIDDANLKPGTPAWTHAVEHAIQQASQILVLLSPGVHESVWVDREIGFAQDHNKEIIPVIVTKTHRPLALARCQGLSGDPIYTEEPEKVIMLLLQTLFPQC